jgi:hypothetical protein
MQNKQKIGSSAGRNWKNIFAVFFCVLMLTFSPIQTRKAQAWDALPANIVLNIMNEIERMIRGMIINLLKQGAIKSINQEMDSLLGGSSTSGALFITDWQDYLVKQPMDRATTHLNDYLSQATSGRGYSSSYKSSSYSSSQKNFYGKLVEDAQLDNDENTLPAMTYEGNPDDMLTEGDPSYNILSFLSGINHPAAFKANARAVYLNKKDEEREQAQAKSIAYQGFIGTGESYGSGAITSPGILTKELKSSAQAMGMNQITSATNPEEVVMAVVSQMVSKMVSQGIGNVRRTVQRETSAVTNKINSEMNSAIKSSGPAALYK